MCHGAAAMSAPTAPTELLLERANFVTRFAPGDVRNRAVHALHGLLLRLDAQAPVSAVGEWLEDAAAWVQGEGGLPGGAMGEAKATARLKLFLEALEALPATRGALQRAVARVLEAASAVALFTDTGLPSAPGFFAEATARLTRSLLPEPPVDNELARLVFRLFPTARSVQWFEALEPGLVERLSAALGLPQGGTLERVAGGLREAAVLLATRLAALGTADDVRARAKGAPLEQSPFLALPGAVRAFTHREQGALKSAGLPEVAARELVASCRKAARDVMLGLDQTGISVDLVYRLELITRMLDRLYTLLALSVPNPEGTSAVGRRFLITLLKGGLRDRSLSEVVRSNSRLLARRVIERAGHTGEHYITATREEQHAMVNSAGGGGVVTAVSVVLKFLIGWAGLPLLTEALALGLNYALGFVSMQLLHFTLATKQPSMTAATLAGALKETSESEEPELAPLVELIVRTVRSQLAAIIGNLGMVVPTAIAIDLLWRLGTGHSVLDAAQAAKLVDDHHPLFSGTALYAALTGVALWASSILAGTVENWFVFNQLPEAIASSRLLRSAVGGARARRVSDFFARNVAGFGGNIGFGLLLGLYPLAFKLLGLPMQVRHITFATGQLTLAGLQLGAEGVVQAPFLAALGSIALIGALNFSVSFSLAMAVALRAREVGALGQLRLAAAVLTRFRSAPLDFLRAPRTSSSAAASTSV